MGLLKLKGFSNLPIWQDRKKFVQGIKDKFTQNFREFLTKDDSIEKVFAFLTNAAIGNFVIFTVPDDRVFFMDYYQLSCNGDGAAASGNMNILFVNENLNIAQIFSGISTGTSESVSLQRPIKARSGEVIQLTNVSGGSFSGRISGWLEDSKK